MKGNIKSSDRPLSAISSQSGMATKPWAIHPPILPNISSAFSTFKTRTMDIPKPNGKIGLDGSIEMKCSSKAMADCIYRYTCSANSSSSIASVLLDLLCIISFLKRSRLLKSDQKFSD